LGARHAEFIYPEEVAEPMPKNLQIRNVPDDVHAAIRARAAEEGLSMSDYLLRELREIARRPTNAEILERALARSRESGPTSEEIVAAVRSGRGE
jgi:plasmid stability protein